MSEETLKADWAVFLTDEELETFAKGFWRLKDAVEYAQFSLGSGLYIAAQIINIKQST